MVFADKLARFLLASKHTVPIWSAAASWSSGPTWQAPAAAATPSGLLGSTPQSAGFLEFRRPYAVDSTRFAAGAVSGSTPVRQPPDPDRRPCSSEDQADTVTVEIQHGLPHVTVPLPSRSEKCVFVLRPVTHTVGDLLEMLKTEDHGIDRAVIRNLDGVRIASTTSIQSLLAAHRQFDLVVNEVAYRVSPPTLDDASASISVHGVKGLSEEELRRMGDVRALVGQLYEALHVQEHQASQEQRLLQELEALQDDLAPLEEQRKILAAQAEKRTHNLTWLGLGMMSMQFGILARLTWWEYSWDIMEPVTYFVTYGTAVACYAYFVLTKQDYVLPDVRDRQFLINFYKRAKKSDWDVERYNRLKDSVIKVEHELKRLRDPLKLRIPHPALQNSAKASSNSGLSLLGAQVNIGQLKDMLKSKLKQ